jgi:hypothetical protein
VRSITSRYSTGRALPPPPPDATPTSVQRPLPTYFAKTAFRASDEPWHSSEATSPINPPPISLPAPLRPSPSRRRSTQSPVAHGLHTIGSIIPDPPPRVDSASSSDNKNVAEPPERSNAGFFFTKTRSTQVPVACSNQNLASLRSAFPIVRMFLGVSRASSYRFQCVPQLRSQRNHPRVSPKLESR